MKKLNLILIFPFMAAAFFMAGCDLTPKDDSAPIFTGTTNITCTSPISPPAISPVSFVWESPGTTYQVVGVFTNHISVNGKRIQNKNDCVAMWTTAMTGSAGSVNYSNFRKVVNGEIQSTTSAPTLAGTYYWAVWGYDSKMSITHSSGEKTFTTP